jgi:SulP family sulfate permease
MQWKKFCLKCKKKGIRVVFTGLHGQVESMFKKIDIVPDLIPEEDCFKTFNDCIVWLNNYLK